MMKKNNKNSNSMAMYQLALLSLLSLHTSCAFTIPHHQPTQRTHVPTAMPMNSHRTTTRRSFQLYVKEEVEEIKDESKNTSIESTEAGASSPAETTSLSADTQEDDDDEWEYEEFDFLEESDFYSSEWKVGTLMDGSNKKIEETWCRLLLQEGEFVCIWGDGAKGKWNFDKTSQFLSMSKDTFGGWFGKQIWAGTVDDFYYLQGTVRGWSPISPASVVGQWQAKRLGVSKDEDPGIAPWFQEEEETETEDAMNSSDDE